MLLPIIIFGYIEEFAYIYGSDKNAVVIDPGEEADKIKEIVKEHNLNVKAILLTHGHFDHIGAAKTLAEFYNAPICGGVNINGYTKDPEKNLSVFTGSEISFGDVIEKAEGDIIEIDEDFKLKIINTPGHTADSVTYYDEKNGVAFVGDTTFEGSYGRTDFPGGDEKTLFNSIKTKIFKLKDDVKLYSGHSNMTTVGVEKKRGFYE